MKYLLSSSALVVAIFLTLVSGVLHGRFSQRFSRSQALDDAAERLKQLPTEFGPWRLESRKELSESAQAMLECAGYVHGTYVNGTSGHLITLAVIVGPHGPISVHTPEICFPSRNYKQQSDRERVDLETDGSLADAFWAVTFRSTTLDSHLLRSYYAWNMGDKWQAPESARLTFSGEPFLYKVQLAFKAPPGTNLDTHDACLQFLRDFVPVFRSTVASAAG